MPWWYGGDGLHRACDLFDRHARLALLNARILVGPARRLDPICAEMAASPLVDDAGIPGKVLLGFMAGACVVRKAAYEEVGGYDERVFIGGEEESLALSLAKAGWELRYVEWLVTYHFPSLANFQRTRAHGMRNTLWSAWLHRRMPSAVRHTAFTLWDSPKDRSYVRAVAMALCGLPWIVRERRPMDAALDRKLRALDARRFASRRAFWTFHQPGAANPPSWDGHRVLAAGARACTAGVVVSRARKRLSGGRTRCGL